MSKDKDIIFIGLSHNGSTYGSDLIAEYKAPRGYKPINMRNYYRSKLTNYNLYEKAKIKDEHNVIISSPQMAVDFYKALPYLDRKLKKEYYHTILLIRKNIFEVFLSFLVHTQILLPEGGKHWDILGKGKDKKSISRGILCDLNKEIIKDLLKTGEIDYNHKMAIDFIKELTIDYSLLHFYPLTINHIAFYEDLKGDYSQSDAKILLGDQYYQGGGDNPIVPGKGTARKMFNSTDEKIKLIKNKKLFWEDWDLISKTFNLDKNNELKYNKNNLIINNNSVNRKLFNF
tara:strand:- start:1538 stop:2398 length:861 start_codon:yes stop_codon:yes gene_type:complete